jgi:hypothetical protein
MARKSQTAIPAQRPNIARHQSCCKICAHPQREEIERAYVSWQSAQEIAAEFKLRDRSSVYRHANAFDLDAKRARNVRAVLCRLIERAGEVKPNGAAIVQAIALLAKINTRGEFVEPGEQLGTHELFARMTPEEHLAYAVHETLPDWWEKEAAKATNNSGGRDA